MENLTTTNTYDGTPCELQSADIVIACVATSYGSADQLCSTIVSALDGSAGTWSSMQVQGVFLHDDGIADDVVTEADTEEILFYVREATFQVWYLRQ